MPSSVLSSGTSNSQYGRTASTPNSAAQAAASAIANFLKVAPRKWYTILGTLAGTNPGGANSQVIWQQPIPVIPAFCVAVDYDVQLPVKLTLGKKVGTVTGSVVVSAFAPYSALQQQMTLGGAPPWPMFEMTPWYLDYPVHHVNYDWQYPGLGNNAGYFATILDEGPIKQNVGTATTNVKPGTKVVNSSTTTVATKTYKWTFRIRQQLQRKRHLLWGSVPFGDPENRPNNVVQLSTLIGKTPTSNMFTNAAGGATTKALTKGTTKVYAKYELAYIDLLPPTITAVPQPLVNYGLQVTPFSITNLAAGVLQPITHRTAQIYTSIHHVLINNQAGLRADYFGLWDDQDQQSARWAFDSMNNTQQEWFDLVQRTYRRYFTTGHYFVDMENGIFPEIPSVTPYDALMSPDASYAQAFSVPVTPAMSTSFRIKSTVTIATSKVRVYAFGLVRVPY